MMEWLISLVPWWLYLAAPIIAVVVVWRLLGWQGALAAAASMVAALSYGKGRAEGKAIIEAEQNRARLDAVKRRKEVDDDVKALGSNDVDERLKRWNRVED